MQRGDLEIGPCYTAPQYRNQGIFTKVIQKIMYDFKKHQIWMFCDEFNAASRCGIEKAGLKLVSKGKRTKPFGFRLLGRFVFDSKIE